MQTIHGQPSVPVTSDLVTAFVTVRGGHLGPVSFQLPSQVVQPFSIAPWAEETLDPKTAQMIRSLRGDFFCAPFGGNETSYEGERHPPHGDTANLDWDLRAEGLSILGDLELRTRRGHVGKTITLRRGETNLYLAHEISGMSGALNYGHHAMLRFDSPGRLYTSPFLRGQVLPTPFENPAQGGYSSLRPGGRFESLCEVTMSDGKVADLSKFPAREGFEDLVMISADPKSLLAWNAVVFPEQGYMWFSLRDPGSLASTVLWHSNGGRHYAPWNGRHRAVLGVEDVTSYFHYGLAESCAPNPVSEEGIPTCVKLRPDQTFHVPYIMGVAPLPSGFEEISAIEPEKDGLKVSGISSAFHHKVDLSWISGQLL